jgi:hypothetical protein
MKLKPWAIMPTAWIQQEGLRRFDWRTDGSAGTVALMIYYVMCQFAAPRPLRASEAAEPAKRPLPPARPLPVVNDVPWTNPSMAVQVSPPLPAPPNPAALGHDVPPWMSPPPEGRTIVVPNLGFTQIPAPEWGASRPASPEADNAEITAMNIPDSLVVRLTYDDLIDMTGRSRERISAGLDKLVAEGIIWRVDKSSTYGLCGYGANKRFVKLPGRALLSPGGVNFLPYTHFKLRSKDELNALKLHFYYAHARDKAKPYSEVQYSTIQERTGVRQADIPRANSLLISTGILQRTRGLPSEDIKKHESNKYYLTGYEDLMKKKTPA